MRTPPFTSLVHPYIQTWDAEGSRLFLKHSKETLYLQRWRENESIRSFLENSTYEKVMYDCLRHSQYQNEVQVFNRGIRMGSSMFTVSVHVSAGRTQFVFLLGNKDVFAKPGKTSKLRFLNSKKYSSASLPSFHYWTPGRCFCWHSHWLIESCITFWGSVFM